MDVCSTRNFFGDDFFYGIVSIVLEICFLETEHKKLMFMMSSV